VALIGLITLFSVTAIPAAAAGGWTALPLYGCGAILILLVILAVLVYRFFDWSNDIYRLTPDQILDIERRPLGEETKKTANLDAIQSVEHQRGNIIGILLNFGTVTVTVGETKFIFLGVHNPDQVHQDISAYRQAQAERKEKKEQQKQQDAMKQWFITYFNRTQEMGGVFPPIEDEADATEADLLQVIGGQLEEDEAADYLDEEDSDQDEDLDLSDDEEAPLDFDEEYLDEYPEDEA
jgi:hypothetical protein